MKALNLILVAVIFGMSFLSPQAQTRSKLEEIVIQTSAQCGMCKERIETDLKFTKGVRFVNLDLKTKKVTVRYQAAKTSPDDIRKAIANIGYDADEVVADPIAYEKLPACCKKGGHDQDHSGTKE